MVKTFFVITNAPDLHQLYENLVRAKQISANLVTTQGKMQKKRASVTVRIRFCKRFRGVIDTSPGSGSEIYDKLEL